MLHRPMKAAPAPLLKTVAPDLTARGFSPAWTLPLSPIRFKPLCFQSANTPLNSAEFSAAESGVTHCTYQS